MTIVRSIAAAFEDPRGEAVGPFDAALRVGEQLALEAGTPRAASIAARMFAAIVKPTSGTIFVGDFDTRLQPPQAKRCIAFVDAGGFGGDAHAFACEAAFRADVWGIDVARNRERARALLRRFGTDADAYAGGLALALCVPGVALAILDQPPPGTLDALRTQFPHLAVLATCVVPAVAVPRSSAIVR